MRSGSPVAVVRHCNLTHDRDDRDDRGKQLRGETMTVDLAAFDAARNEYEEQWNLLDQVLYDLCEQYPGHTTRRDVNAKLQIIGRTYGTGIERMIPSRGGQGGAFIVLGDHVFEHAGTIDAIIGGLAGLREPLDRNSLQRIITAQGDLVRLLKQVTHKTKVAGETRSPHAFASKYLHFHNPALPIYDSYATVALTKLRRWRRAFQLFDMPDGSDVEYGRFVLRFWQLYRDVRAVRLDATVKHVDYYLLTAAGNRTSPTASGTADASLTIEP